MNSISWIALRMQHSEVLKSGVGLACLKTSVQISSPLPAFHSSGWKLSISYLQWSNTYQMSLFGSAEAGRPLLQLPTFSLIDTEIVYLTFLSWSYYFSSLGSEKIWSRKPRREEFKLCFTKHTKCSRLICVKIIFKTHFFGHAMTSN